MCEPVGNVLTDHTQWAAGLRQQHMEESKLKMFPTRWFAFAVVPALAFTMFACGPKPEDGGTPPPQPPPATQPDTDGMAPPPADGMAPPPADGAAPPPADGAAPPPAQ